MISPLPAVGFIMSKIGYLHHDFNFHVCLSWHLALILLQSFITVKDPEAKSDNCSKAKSSYVYSILKPHIHYGPIQGIAGLSKHLSGCLVKYQKWAFNFKTSHTNLVLVRQVQFQSKDIPAKQLYPRKKGNLHYH